MLKKYIRKRFPGLVQFRIDMRDWLDRRSPPRVTPWGFTLAGHEAMAAGTFEPDETSLVRQTLKEVDVLINVGANVGYYCCHALSMGIPVIAVEPINRNLHYLLTNILNNGWSQKVEVFPIALGASKNILEMWGGGTGASLVKGWASAPPEYVTHVPVLTLDRILGESIKGKRALILVDIEGAEFPMLQGAFETLRNDPKPIWIVEIASTEHLPKGTTMNPNYSKTFQLFFECGYSAVTANSRMDKIFQVDVDEVVSGAKKLQTHNFIFRELNDEVQL